MRRDELGHTRRPATSPMAIRFRRKIAASPPHLISKPTGIEIDRLNPILSAALRERTEKRRRQSKAGTLGRGLSHETPVHKSGVDIMKSTLLAIALTSAGFMALPAAQAADNSGFFINGNIGQSNLSKGIYDGNDTGYGANIGYRWAVAPSFLLGVEGGYADLGSFAPRSFSNISNASLKGWNAGINAHWNLTNNWYLSGRTGYFRGNLKGSYVTAFDPTTNIYVVSSVNGNNNNWYTGAGFGYDFNNNLSVGLNYDYYKSSKSGLNLSPSLVSVSAEYRF
jgi:OOP family OmpA-OmpF porin/outer membrane immunogenic protein